MQALPSLQLTLGPPLHPPPLHLSLLVHALPSLQLFELFENTHPFEALHESLVHPLPSLQDRAAPPLQPPPLHLSFFVQALPSSQPFELLENTHPLPGLHESLVHPFPSLQETAAPAKQLPPAHWSFCVQALPSVHTESLGVCTHPLTEWQLSFVQLLPSSQMSAIPPN